jgi:hypothetical protein
MPTETIPSWGEKLGNHAVGDILVVPKPRNTIRLHYQNANGISLGKQGTWDHVCESWRQMEVDIGLLCETKLDTTCPGVIRELKEGASRQFGLGTFRIVAGSTPTRQ